MTARANELEELEGLDLTNLSTLVLYLQVWPEPTQVEHRSGASLKFCLLVLPAYIRLGREP